MLKNISSAYHHMQTGRENIREKTWKCVFVDYCYAYVQLNTKLFSFSISSLLEPQAILTTIKPFSF